MPITEEQAEAGVEQGRRAARLWARLRRSQLASIGATDVALLVLSTVSGILVARLLGPAGRGEFAVAILWPSVLAAFGNLGIKEALTYECASASTSPKVLVGMALQLAMLQSIVLVSAGAILIPLLTSMQSEEVTRAGLLYLLFIPTNLLAQYALGMLQGSMEISHYNLLRLIMGAVYLATILALWAFGLMTPFNATSGLLLANCCTALTAVVLVLRKWGMCWSLDFGLLQRILSYGLKNHLGSISSILNQRADQMLMSLLVTPEQLGLYAVAVNVTSLARLPSTAIATLTFPRVAGAAPEDRGRVSGQYSRVNTTISGSMTVGLALLIPFLIPLLYGAEYASSIVPAEILSVAMLSLAVAQVWAGSLRGLGRPAEPAKAELLSLVVTIVGLALFIRPLGILGAALTSFVAYLVAALHVYRQLRQSLAMRHLDLLRPTSLSTIREHLNI